MIPQTEKGPPGTMCDHPAPSTLSFASATCAASASIRLTLNTGSLLPSAGPDPGVAGRSGRVGLRGRRTRVAAGSDSRTTDAGVTVIVSVCWTPPCTHTRAFMPRGPFVAGPSSYSVRSDGAEPRLEQASARLVPLRLSERARVVLRPDRERVPGDLRRRGKAMTPDQIVAFTETLSGSSVGESRG